MSEDLPRRRQIIVKVILVAALVSTSLSIYCLLLLLQNKVRIGF